MHDGDDRREDEAEDEAIRRRAAERGGPSTDQVRIVGAEVAGEATAVVPAVTRADLFGEAEPPDEEATEAAVHLTSEPSDAETMGHAVRPVQPGETVVPTGSPSATQLPHWTEAPTGQVPAVLSRDSDEGSGSYSGISAPSWRQEDSDWVAQEQEFEPAMFGDDEHALGSLDETNRTDAERRPWEFDLPASETPRTRRSRRSGGPDRTSAAETGTGRFATTATPGSTPEPAIEDQLTTQVPAVPRSPESPGSPSPGPAWVEGVGYEDPIGAGSRRGEREGGLPSSRATRG
ncbi:MAG: hypothetical protein ACRDWB_02440, partial [Acidimicrobiales bacterium]